LKESYENLGYNYNLNAEDGEPTGLTELTQSYLATLPSESKRQHSGYSYDVFGVHVICESLVVRILLDASTKATGVELINGAKLAARREVIMSCGTQKTPQLLLLSGIGLTEELQKHNIPISVDSYQVR
jgi:hypothetical protein